MPALRLFGRKWLVASDDFVFPGLFEIAFRFIWLVLVSLVCAHFYGYTWDCAKGGDLVRIYLAGVVALLGAIIAVLVPLVNRSAQGSIMDTNQRKCVPALVAVKILLILPEIAWNVLGTLWMFGDVVECGSENFTVVVVEGLVLFNWVLLGLSIFGLAMVFDPLGSVQLNEEEDHHRKVMGLWMWRFQWAFCWVRKDKLYKEAFQHVAGLFSALFRSTDLSPSDFIAGFILLRVKQKRDGREYRRQQLLAERPDNTLIIQDVMREAPPWMTLELAKHYLTYAMGAYSWPFVMYRWPFSGLCRLSSKMLCCACIRRKPHIVQDDNCCLCNLAGFRHISGLDMEDVLYASFENAVFQAPFFVSLDHVTQSVVVTIRGSISLRDLFTDFTAGADRFEVEGLPPDTMAHKGMIIGANNIKACLDEQKILEKAFTMYPEYNLVISGHSLGAGIGTLLALLLRPQYPDVRVYSVSPPAAVLTRDAARLTESFCFSVGLGDDFVMRLSVDSTENLRTNILDALHRCRLPKYRLMLNGFGYTLFGVPNGDLETTWKPEEASPSTLLGHSPLLEAAPVKTETSMLTKDVTLRRFSKAHLYTPGRILHISRRKLSKTERQYGPGSPRYEVRWAIPEEYTELQVLPRMILDHLPENVDHAIATLLQEQDMPTHISP